MATHHITMIAADAYRNEHYGVLLVSETKHSVSGRGLHNPSFNHVFEVWENRVWNGVLSTPDGKPTEESHSYYLRAQATVISTTPSKDKYGDGVAVGDTVVLWDRDGSLGEYVITARQLADPILVPVSKEV